MTLCRPPYSLLLVEEPRTRNSSTELLSDILHDDCTTCFVSSHRYITYSWLVWEKWFFFVVSDTDGSEEKIWVLPICRVCTSLEICPTIFQSWKKSGKYRQTFFESYQYNKCFTILNFFISCWPNLIQSHLYVCSASWKKLFVPSFF